MECTSRICTVAAIAAAVSVAALGAAAGTTPSAAECGDAPACSPTDVGLSCTVDACVVRVRYVVADRRDDHAVRIRFTTEPARGYADNAADAVERVVPAGAGQPVPSGGVVRAYRYAVSDVLWHSDIRCDALVHVTASGPAGSSVRTVRKEVPRDPGSAWCSDLGAS